MGRSYPTLTPAEVCEILRELGFYHPADHRKGSHQKWVNSLTRCSVDVDTHYDTFTVETIKYMIGQAHVTREQFYGATKRTAKKIR